MMAFVLVPLEGTPRRLKADSFPAALTEFKANPEQGVLVQFGAVTPSYFYTWSSGDITLGSVVPGRREWAGKIARAVL